VERVDELCFGFFDYALTEELIAEKPLNFGFFGGWHTTRFGWLVSSDFEEVSEGKNLRCKLLM